MHRNFHTLAHALHRITAGVCVILLTILVAAEILIVVLRHVFGMDLVELQAVVNYSFAILVVLALPVALRLDKHVRVDLFGRGQPARTAGGIDLVGILALLLPVFLLAAHFVAPDILYSWSILEDPVEFGQVSGGFLIKLALAVSCLLMMIQGAARLISPPGNS